MEFRKIEVLDKILQKAKSKKATIVLPEGKEPRMLHAAQRAVKDGTAEIMLLGNRDEISGLARENNVDLGGVQIQDPAEYADSQSLAQELHQRRRKKGMSPEQALALVRTDTLYFGDMLVQTGKAQGCLAGAINSTGNVVKAALYCIGSKEGLVSSYFLMLVPGFKEDREYTPFIFADCAVMPNPTADQLAIIAMAAAESRAKVMGDEPLIAMLSFSTKGSARHADVEKVTSATEIIKSRQPDLIVDGEFQLDAAVIESIGKRKAPESRLAGRANVLIFPDLDAGNICYKATERFGRAIAVGPVLQGLNKPCNDLSRGCSVDDIYLMIAITAVSA
jgi:phosphate acetyltransferase